MTNYLHNFRQHLTIHDRLTNGKKKTNKFQHKYEYLSMPKELIFNTILHCL